MVRDIKKALFMRLFLRAQRSTLPLLSYVVMKSEWHRKKSADNKLAPELLKHITDVSVESYLNVLQGGVFL